MDHDRPYDVESYFNKDHAPVESISVTQLQRLVRLLDASDVSEVEVKRVAEGTRLVLRKASASDNSGLNDYQLLVPLNADPQAGAPEETKQIIKASLVGIFHHGARRKGKALVSVGDRIKVGQLVGGIEALNVFSEVEAPIAGRVVEILARDGQPVEYGQHLLVIDTAEEA